MESCPLKRYSLSDRLPRERTRDNDMSAISLILLSYALIFASPNVRNNSRLRAALLFVITAHHIAAYFHSHISLLPGADRDSEGFYHAAAHPEGTHRIAYLYYVKFLTLVFSFTGPSRLVACELSIIAFVLASLFLVELAIMIRAESYAPSMILVFGLLPTSLVHFSTPLRESFEMLAITATALAGSKIRVKFSAAWTILFVAASIVLNFIHKALGKVALGIAGLAAVALMKKFGRTYYAVLAFALAAIAFTLAVPSSSSLDDVVRNFEQVEKYREGVEHAGGRAFYGGQIDPSSLASLATTVPQVVVFYFVAPLPHQIGSPLDIYCALENLLRLILAGAAFLKWRRMEPGVPKDLYTFLGSMFLWVEFVWALGTGNWGTALRHHSISLMIPILLGIPAVFNQAQIQKTKPLSARGRARQRRTRRSRNRRKKLSGEYETS